MVAAVWKGAISFGLVNVPVSLHSAVRSKNVRFHQLHAEDGGRVELRRTCGLDGKQLSWDEVAKGFEISKGEHVIIDDAEIEALEARANQAIEIEDFVPLNQVDPVFFDRSYILLPDPSVHRPYQLLREAMVAQHRVGIARIVLRTKEHLCIIRAAKEGLVLSTLHYEDELVNPASIGSMPENKSAPKRELDMARQLIEAMSAEFEPSRYHDQFRESLMDLVGRKAKGESVAASRHKDEVAPIIDLATALEASLGGSKGPRANSTKVQSTKAQITKANGVKAKDPIGANTQGANTQGANTDVEDTQAKQKRKRKAS